jgi:hypothetical protein
MESPKGFFELLRADPRRVHRLIAKRLTDSGFEVRRVRKRVHHQLWEVDIRRGSVAPGLEEEKLRLAIRGALSCFAVSCPLGDVEFCPRGGDRISGAFLLDRGVFGSLTFSKGEEKWSSERWA